VIYINLLFRTII